MKLLVEAVVVGLSLALFVWLLRLTNFKNTKNEFAFMFIVGVLIHLSYEILGLNKWYCKNGSACN